MNRHLVLAIVVMITGTIGPSLLLKPLSVEAQETTNTTTGTVTIDISNNLTLGSH